MNLIQKVGSKIQNKIESGDFNQEKLVDEAQQMMSSLQGSGFNNLFSISCMFKFYPKNFL